MINLYQNFYQDKNAERQKELNFCLEKNLQNSLLNVVLIESQKRLSFNDFFKKINQISSPTDINIISNLDIFFDHTIEFVLTMKPNHCYALSRWDLLKDGNITHFNRADSQDSFIIKGKVKQMTTKDIPLGFLGCDNAISFFFEQAGYKVYNPSKTIRSIHMHQSDIRNYQRAKEFIVPPPYKMVPPIKLEDVK
jgi:hypothetical protein